MQINHITKMRIKRRRFARQLKAKLDSMFGGRFSRISPANIAWGLVILGGVVECFWVSGLKYANTPLLYALTTIGIIFSFTMMVLALKVLEVSIAYSVFVGIGTAGVVASEILVFGEAFSALKVSLIAILLFAVIALKMSAKHSDSEEVLVESMASDLGVDKALDSILGDSKSADSKESKANKGIIDSKNSKDSKGGEK